MSGEHYRRTARHLRCSFMDDAAANSRVDDDVVRYEVRERVAVITVNDPDRRNAVTDAMSAQLRDAVERAERDSGVHAVVVTGAGRAFCAGADLSRLRVCLEKCSIRFLSVASGIWALSVQGALPKTPWSRSGLADSIA